MTIDMFISEAKHIKDYIYVGNVENENADNRINELNHIRAICTNDAKDIHGGNLTTHKAVSIHKDDYSSYNDLMQRSIRSSYKWN